MKRCDYCGAESADDLEICPGCGLAYSDPSHLVSVISKPFSWRLLIECIGYLAAVPVAFFGSIFAEVACDLITHNLLISYAVTGFLGVLLGALCFPRSKKRFRNRIFGSALLLVIGLDFELRFSFVLNPISQAYGHGLLISVQEIIATAVGGLAAGALHYWLRPREARDVPPPLPVGQSAVRQYLCRALT